ncbi:MAG: carbohydrate ABC transporter permease [Chloroflexota bacterium]|nr:carbohydrate ABC transporter permease [Chloroflexota bacterium]MDE2951150.1 carbohydrate ABC transporter permease [Chloroflexota bacterium]
MVNSGRARLERLLAYLISLLAILITLFPIVWLLTISFKRQRDAFAMPPKFIFEPIWDHYLALLDRPGFVQAFLNTVYVTALGVLIAIVIAIFASYGIHRFRFRGKQLFGVWLLLAYMLPEFLFVIPMYVLYQKIGWYDTHIGLALVYQVHSLPFAVWLIRSFFKEVPSELDDASRIDGCNHLGTLRHVFIPLAAPGIAATAILTAIWIWNELTIALSLSFSEAQTITVAVASFRGYTSIAWGPMSAASIVAILPMLIFAVFAQKYIVKGLTLGSLKG